MKRRRRSHRKLTTAQHAVLIAHLDAFGALKMKPSRDDGRRGTRFHQIALTLEHYGLLNIGPDRSSVLTDAGRAALEALLARWTAAFVVDLPPKPPAPKLVLHYRAFAERSENRAATY